MKLKIAQIQMTVTKDREENIRRACRLVHEAGDVDMAVLPEMFCCPYDNACFRQYGEAEGGAAWQALSALAAARHIWLVGGTVPELAEGRVYNTCYVFDPEGRCVAKHRKVHLFDIDIRGGTRFMESETLAAGDRVTTFPTPWGIMGVCVCFDLRFAELSQLMALAGAQVIFVPAAFNMHTGPAHWELLFRCRAVDQQCYMVGTATARDVHAGYVAWGHSIVCDPWGTVVYQCGAGEETAVVTLDMERVADIRQQLPVLSARRTDVYTLRENRLPPQTE